MSVTGLEEGRRVEKALCHGRRMCYMSHAMRAETLDGQTRQRAKWGQAKVGLGSGSERKL